MPAALPAGPRPSYAAEPRGRYATLDAMRGVAALCVALFHLGGSIGYDVAEGYLAVDLFFALSGFVIALNYGPRLAGDMSWHSFMTKRLIRLYPLYAIGTMLGIARRVWQLARLGPHGPGFAGTAIACLLGLVMLPTPPGVGGFPEPALFPINGPAWSLFLEMAVNLGFALILFRLDWRWLAALCTAAALYLSVRIGAPLWFNVGWIWPNADAGVARALYAFALGMLLLRAAPAQHRRSSWLAVAVVAAMAAVLCTGAPGLARKPFELAMVLVVLPMLLYGGIRCELPRVLQRPAFFVGDMSYGIYAVHWPLVPPFVTIAIKMHWSHAASTAIFLGLLTAIGAGLHYGFDLPVRRWLSRRQADFHSARHPPALPQASFSAAP